MNAKLDHRLARKDGDPFTSDNFQSVAAEDVLYWRG